jgi:hypothetical protein
MDKKTQYKQVAVIVYCIVLLVLVIVILTMDRCQTEEIVYVKSEWGCYNLSADLSTVSTPEPYGQVWNVSYVIDGGAMFKYFEDEQSAWAFYSFLRMTYTGGQYGQ